MRVEVEGADEAQRALERAAVEVEQLDPDASRAGAELVLEAATSTAPRRTGALASSGHLRVDGRVVEAVFGARYARPVHGGVPSRNMAANPFLTAAAARVEARVVEVYERAVDKIVDRADR